MRTSASTLVESAPTARRRGSHVRATPGRPGWWRATVKRLRIGMVAAPTALLAVGTCAAPASATVDFPPVPMSVDNVVALAPQVDFGDGRVLDLWGNPAPGHVIWMWDPDDGSWWPLLDGKIFINNAAGLCARMQIAYYTASYRLITTRNGGTVCSPNNRLNAWNVSLMPYGSASVNQIEIRLQTVGANGVATTVDTFGPVFN